ncbi:hypothetical protein ACCO45_002683 [Purpureocillium lilacinum]|uniref:Uncharacterized protein n=1 Tax=Purpureocillium lilacinum TaxID=33203 RepID=A0ACC4EBP0_PURLI
MPPKPSVEKQARSGVQETTAPRPYLKYDTNRRHSIVPSVRRPPAGEFPRGERTTSGLAGPATATSLTQTRMGRPHRVHAGQSRGPSHPPTHALPILAAPPAEWPPFLIAFPPATRCPNSVGPGSSVRFCSSARIVSSLARPHAHARLIRGHLLPRPRTLTFALELFNRQTDRFDSTQLALQPRSCILSSPKKPSKERSERPTHPTRRVGYCTALHSTAQHSAARHRERRLIAAYHSVAPRSSGTQRVSPTRAARSIDRLSPVSSAGPPRRRRDRYSTYVFAVRRTPARAVTVAAPNALPGECMTSRPDI